MPWVRPRRDSTTRGVKALDTSPRSRVWSGGSRNRKGRISSMAAAIASVPSGNRRNSSGIRSWTTLRLSELERRSRRTVRQSSCRATTQKPIWLRWIGARARRSA